jgi:hypothetical protein
MRYALIITEGPHDQAFVEKCLKVFYGFNGIPNDIEDVETSAYWKDAYRV